MFRFRGLGFRLRVLPDDLPVRNVSVQFALARPGLDLHRVVAQLVLLRGHVPCRGLDLLGIVDGLVFPFLVAGIPRVLAGAALPAAAAALLFLVGRAFPGASAVLSLALAGTVPRAAAAFAVSLLFRLTAQRSFHAVQRLLQRRGRRAALPVLALHRVGDRLHLRFGHLALFRGLRQLFRQLLRLAGKILRGVPQRVGVQLQRRGGQALGVPVFQGVRRRVHAGVAHRVRQFLRRVARGLVPEFLQPLFRLVQRHQRVHRIAAVLQVPLQVVRDLPQLGLFRFALALFLFRLGFVDGFHHRRGLLLQLPARGRRLLPVPGNQGQPGARDQQRHAAGQDSPRRLHADLLRVQRFQVRAGVLPLGFQDLRRRAAPRRLFRHFQRRHGPLPQSASVGGLRGLPVRHRAQAVPQGAGQRAGQDDAPAQQPPVPDGHENGDGHQDQRGRCPGGKSRRQSLDHPPQPDPVLHRPKSLQ